MLKRLQLLGKSLSFSTTASTSANNHKYPMYVPKETDELRSSSFVKFQVAGVVRIVELSRPSALNAINTEMVSAIADALRKWQDNPNCRFVVLKSAVEGANQKTKSFCAGGDIIAIASDQLGLNEKSDFFKQEYQLNHLIGTYKKPIISILDGITMGGGAGLSVHGQYRISTESTLFAMPETAIGFFPDVGASFFLSRLFPHHFGLYLALTGTRIKGADNYRLGISTHHIPSTRVEDVISSLHHLQDGVKNLCEYLDQFSDGQLDDPSPSSRKNIADPKTMALIEKHFSKGSLNEIFRSLESAACTNESGSGEKEWSRETLDIMKQMSPTSLAVTFTLLEKGRKMFLKKCLMTEYNLARNFITRVPDMKNGITSKLIKKEKTVLWNPASLSEVDPKFIESLFEAPTNNETDELSFYNENEDYEYYPHATNTLPSQSTIKQMIQDATGFRNEQELINYICQQYNERTHLRHMLNELFHSHVKVTKEECSPNVKFQWY